MRAKGAETGRLLFTINRHPIYYLQITKCGCTFVKNLLYALDHDGPHPNADDIHDHEDAVPRAVDVDLATVRQSPFAFTVVRNPVDRFLSLYFDKIWGDGTRNFPALRQTIAQEAGLDLARELSVEAHRQNCQNLIAWLGRNIAGKTAHRINPHWRPQIERLRIAKDFQLKVLPLEHLDAALSRLLKPLIPDIDDRIAQVTARNRTMRVVAKADLMDPTLERAILEIYAADHATHLDATRAWSPALYTPSRKAVTLVRPRALALNIVPVLNVAEDPLRALILGIEATHPDPLPRQRRGWGVRSNARLHEINDTEITIVPVVDPATRLLHLYHADLIAPASRRSRRFAEPLLAAGFDPSADSRAAHRANMTRLLDWIAQAHQTKAVHDVPDFARPQVYGMDALLSVGAMPIPGDTLKACLQRIAASRLPDLLGHLHHVAEDQAVDFLTTTQRERIADLYAADQALYATVRAAWQKSTLLPQTEDFYAWQDAKRATPSRAG